MKQLTVRNVTPEIAKALSEESRRRGKSINQTVIDLLLQALGLEANSRYDNGLARLSGTWSEEDLARFTESAATFEQIDEEFWRK